MKRVQRALVAGVAPVAVLSLTAGFGDLGPSVMPLYSIYFNRRDRVVRLAREFSQVIARFADSGHLLIGSVAPAASAGSSGSPSDRASVRKTA
jgi:hypothetical protein